MADAVEDFLAHIGVKGMRWGRRSNKSSSKTPKKSLTPRQKEMRRKAIAGAATTGAILALHAGLKIADVMANKEVANRRRQINENYSDLMGLPMSSIKLNYNSSTNAWG